MAIQIIPFKSELATEFRDLNLVWLNEYFHLEPKDSELLGRAREEIIDPGGAIFFAETAEGHIIGCFSLIPYGTNSFELGKMTVKKGYEGQKIGHDLLVFAINYTREQGKEWLVLYSNTILETAIYLYRKFGFEEIEMEFPPPYTRSNIKNGVKDLRLNINLIIFKKLKSP